MVASHGTIQNLFGKRLNQIKETLQSRYKEEVSYIITVPDDLNWWYFQEYGTGTRGESGKASGSSYDIVPTSGMYLKIPNALGGYVFVPIVKDHPGINARYSVTKILPELQKYSDSKLREYSILRNPSELETIIKDIADKAKELIIKSFEENLPGSREDGKLEGKTAAQVFSERATVKKE